MSHALCRILPTDGRQPGDPGWPLSPSVNEIAGSAGNQGLYVQYLVLFVLPIPSRYESIFDLLNKPTVFLMCMISVHLGF